MTIKELLDRSRKELLDLSTRNRLLSIPVNSKSARIVEVHDELSEQVFRLLVTEKKNLSFAPGRPSKKIAPQKSEQPPNLDDEEAGLPQPEDELDPETGLAKRHTDAKLQTVLTPEGLQGRLLNLYYDAKTMIEEQGVNVLYLVLGHLKWIEAEHSDTPRYAPLILVPIELERKTASERFRIHWTEDDLEENLSLRAKLKTDFNIELPTFPDDEQFEPGAYFDAVRRAVGNSVGWDVLPDAITLGFFSFAKFLMYRDLEPENWPQEDKLLKHPFITGLLQDGFPQQDPLFPNDSYLDDLIPASKLDHVVDADCSQSVAIETIRQGRSLVIQGPPGTGKSQSITNIIATAVLDGKRVLFIAEKLAALEVVKRRLEREGLGSVCLELHSNKSNKHAVVEEIANTWRLGQPALKDLETTIPKLEQKRDLLNKHVKALHAHHSPSGLTPYYIIGTLSSLGDRSREASVLTFPGAENWTREIYCEGRKIIEELVSRIEAIGQPSLHPWRGICRDTILPIDLPNLESLIKSSADLLKRLQEAIVEVSKALDMPSPDSIEEVKKQILVMEHVLKAPIVDKRALCNSVWQSGIDGLRELLRNGIEFDKTMKEVGDKAAASVWEDDFTDERQVVLIYGKTLFRFLNPKYRRAIGKIRKSLNIRLTETYKEKLSLVDKVIVGQNALKAIRKDESIARSAFGDLWKNENTEWSKIEAVLFWVSQKGEMGIDTHFYETFAQLEKEKVLRLSEELKKRMSAFSESAINLFEWCSIDFSSAFATKCLDSVSLRVLIERFAVWLSNLEDLSRWNNYFIRARRARELNLGQLIGKMEVGAIKPNAALDSFNRIYFGQLFRTIIQQNPSLAQFDGLLHNTCLNEFRELDRDRLLLAKYKTLYRHYKGLPPSQAGIGPSGIVKSEIERKRGHRSVRRLLKDAGSVIQAIKPVFMMSPLSVAQFLEPGSVEFDLLVIDEASQVQPVDAFGAIARCKQIVVVGDNKQLPPTRFFNRLTSDLVEDEEGEGVGTAEAKDIESILGLCSARGIPDRMLCWHYRSKHHSLIAVSNCEFYNNELFIVPSPYSISSALGLKFNYVPDGVFDGGNTGTGTNKIEAKVVCRAIIEHARKNPHLTLGVATFSVKQRKAVLDELELLRRESPDTEAFFTGNPHEPFFVKNLENVQGDERDVIFISVGYGKDAHGWMAMRFGPLSSEGGERRLNVLISRARQRCEVFSSVTADDIDLQRATGRGVKSLKVFLNFAKTGLLSISQKTENCEQSPFEEAVKSAIESLGYEVHSQVGIAGFFIDLAVLDKNGSGRYVLGIECDGASYHSSKSARDRDRLRQSVLEDHGWIIHRIWSIDWFQRPQEQLRKVVAAIEKAHIVLAEVKVQPPEVRVAIEYDSGEIISRTSGIKSNEECLSIPYKEANFRIDRKCRIDEVPAKELADIISHIVDLEGPIHEDEVLVRVRDLWGVNRAGNRIQDAVTSGIRSALISKNCIKEGGFLQKPGKKVEIRNRESVSSSSLRKTEMIAPAEIRAAILCLIEAYHGSTRNEIPGAVARLIGFKTTTGQFRDIVDHEVKKLLKKGEIKEADGMLRVV